MTEQPKKCEHSGTIVKVGNGKVVAVSFLHIGMDTYSKLAGAGFKPVSIALNGALPIGIRIMPGEVHNLPMVDYGGVPEDWSRLIKYYAATVDHSDTHRLVFWCHGGHGRTGTFLASLIAVLEPEVDPILEARNRYCQKAVETWEQAIGIYKLKGMKVPEEWRGKGLYGEPVKPLSPLGKEVVRRIRVPMKEVKKAERKDKGEKK